MKLIQYQRASTGIQWGFNGLSLKSLTFLSLFLITAFSFNTFANPIQSIEEIREAAKKFLEEKQVSADKNDIRVTVGKIDSRLRLAKCAEELEVFLPQTDRNTGRVTVGVRCSAPISWKIFVPARVAQYQEVWVLKNRLSPLDIITKNDIQQQTVTLTDKRKVPLTEMNQLLNASPKRVMPIGAIIYQGSVCLVCQGDKVTVTANNQFLSVNVEGVAMSDATLGDYVQVQNFSTKKIFSAIVTGKNQLNVQLSGTN